MIVPRATIDISFLKINYAGPHRNKREKSYSAPQPASPWPAHSAIEETSPGTQIKLFKITFNACDCMMDEVLKQHNIEIVFI